VGGVTYTYEYDNLHRLLEETTSDNSLPTDADIMVYTYGDSEHINAVTSINYNGTNCPFSYDSNGNMKDGWDLTDPSSIVERDITWNADNMPVSVTRGNVTTNLTYDGDGVRAKKIEVGTTTSTTYYVSNDYEIKDGAPIKYIFAGNLRVAEIEGATTPTVHIFHKDHLGSSTAMTNSAGSKIEGTEYMPFGSQRSHSGTVTSDYLYIDQEHDNESGLYNYDARLYDPVIGKFVSADSIIPRWHDPQSLNRYAYCRNNPLKYIDPNGHVHTIEAKTGGDYDIFTTADYETGSKILDYTVVGAFNEITNTAGFLFNGASNALGYASEAINWAEEKVIIDGLGGNKGDVEALNAYFIINGVGIAQAFTEMKMARQLSSVAMNEVKLTGQIHHGISNKIHKTLEQHPKLKGLYEPRDARFVTQAKDITSHKGYQKWHRQLDKEVSDWLKNNPNANPQQFENYLNERYNQPDLKDFFPNGF
jgi:RHS repeat-associated protein